MSRPTDTSDAALIAWCEKKVDALDAAACDDPAAADTPATAHDEEMFRAIAARLRDGWRAMDDAPRDGTPILVRNTALALYAVEEWRDELWGNDDGLTIMGDVWRPVEPNGRPLPAPPEAGS